MDHSLTKKDANNTQKGASRQRAASNTSSQASFGSGNFSSMQMEDNLYYQEENSEYAPGFYLINTDVTPYFSPMASPMYTPVFITPFQSPMISPMATPTLYYTDDPNQEAATSSLTELANNGTLMDMIFDQTGSRLIQQKIEAASDSELDYLLAAIKPSLTKISTNVFSNYIVQKLLVLRPDLTFEIFQALKGHILTLSRETCGCRVVQSLIYVPESPDKASAKNASKNKRRDSGVADKASAQKSVPFDRDPFFLNNGLKKILLKSSPHLPKNASQRSSVLRLIFSELQEDLGDVVVDVNGNHVVQRLVDSENLFVIEKTLELLADRFGKLAKDAYGCRVMQRLVEKSGVVVLKLAGLLGQKTSLEKGERRKLEANTAKVWAHIETIVEIVGHFLGTLSTGTKGFVTSQHGNYVVQAAVKFCDAVSRLKEFEEWEGVEQAAEFYKKVTKTIRENFLELSTHKYASNVVETCLCYLPNRHKKKITSLLEEEEVLAVLVKDGFGNYVIQTGIKSCENEEKRQYICMKLKEKVIGTHGSHEKHILEFIQKYSN